MARKNAELAMNEPSRESTEELRRRRLWTEFVRINDWYFQHVSPYTVNYLVNISLSRNYFYMATPKAGCSTILATLQRLELGDKSLEKDLPDIHGVDFSPLLRAQQVGSLEKLLRRENFIKFCFVRNPYTRLLSSYLDRIVRKKDERYLVPSAKSGPNHDAEITFADFVDFVCAQSDHELNPHWGIQYYQNMCDKIGYDIVGRFENFDEDFACVLKQIAPDGLEYIRSMRTHATEAGQKTKDYYDESTASKVYGKYRVDFVEFGYFEELP